MADMIAYAHHRRNLQIVGELADLFRRREHVPGSDEFLEVKPYLQSYEFPAHILTERRLNNALRDDRVAAIKDKIKHLGSPADRDHDDDLHMSYVVPRYDQKVVKDDSVNMVFSQAVFEHVDDLEPTYQVLYRWLRPGGFMTNQIDFRSHSTAKAWNGHWTHSDAAWKIIRGRNGYLLNRQPHSGHIDLLKKNGFEVVCDIRFRNNSALRREQLASRFRNMAEDDLTTSGAFIQAVKKA